MGRTIHSYIINIYCKIMSFQMRHGTTGVVLCTLRNIQFPPRPIYAIEYSRLEERVCYAACSDGAIYRIEIPNVVYN